MARKVNPTVELLRKVDLLDGLTTKELESVADVCRRAQFRDGADIVTQGDPSARMYIIIDGTADVFVHGAKVDAIGPGDYFGEIAVIDGQPRAATVTATSAVSALSLAHFNVKLLLRTVPDIGFKMLRKACERIRALESEPIF
jgi:CRP/FNR family transcriptional regulator, cyclic AMP receptor protein